MAFAAVGALIGGTAAVTAATVLAAVAEVGMALSVVGAVTGSKDLMKIGGVMSLVGGIGGMVAGAAGGAAATGGELAGAWSGVGENIPAAATNSAIEDAVVSGMGGAEGPALTGLGGEMAAGPVAEMATAPTSIVNPPPMQQAVQATQSVAPPTTMGQPLQPQATGPGGPVGAQAPAMTQAPPGAQAPGQPVSPYDIDTISASEGVASGTAAPQTSQGYFGRFSQWAEKNKTLFSSGMQLAGGAFKGLSERAMWDEKMENDRQALALRSHGSEVARFQPRGIVAGAGA